jgi:hypothetical protein
MTARYLPDTIQGQREQLEAHGYMEVAEHGRLKPGARVCHRGQRWYEAIMKGTATIVAVYEKPDSPWSVEWHMPDIEVIAQRDDEPEGRCPITWAQYHCTVVGEATS